MGGIEFDLDLVWKLITGAFFLGLGLSKTYEKITARSDTTSSDSGAINAERIVNLEKRVKRNEEFIDNLVGTYLKAGHSVRFGNHED